MKMLEDCSPLLPRRGGHLLLAALTGFMGGYNLWVAAAGLHRGAIWVFTRRLPALASRAVEPSWFWANVAGRMVFAAVLLGCALGCLVTARSARRTPLSDADPPP